MGTKPFFRPRGRRAAARGVAFGKDETVVVIKSAGFFGVVTHLAEEQAWPRDPPPNSRRSDGPLPAAVVASMEWMRSWLAMPFQKFDVSCQS